MTGENFDIILDEFAPKVENFEVELRSSCKRTESTVGLV